MTLYHKYLIYIYISAQKILKFDKNISPFIYFASFFISAKATSNLRNINGIFPVVYNSYLTSLISSEIDIDKAKLKVLDYEWEILSSIGFNVNFDFPYQFITALKKEIVYFNNNNTNTNFNNTANDGNIIITSNNIIVEEKTVRDEWVKYLNFSYLVPFCLFFDELTVALSSLKLAMRKVNPFFEIKEYIFARGSFSNLTNVDGKNFNINISPLQLFERVEECSKLMDELVFSRLCSNETLKKNSNIVAKINNSIGESKAINFDINVDMNDGIKEGVNNNLYQK